MAAPRHPLPPHIQERIRERELGRQRLRRLGLEVDGRAQLREFRARLGRLYLESTRDDPENPI